MYCRCTLLALTRAAVAYRTRRYNLCYMMGNAAPKLRSRFSSPASLPFILLEDNAELQRVLGPAAEDWRSVTMFSLPLVLLEEGLKLLARCMHVS